MEITATKQYGLILASFFKEKTPKRAKHVDTLKSMNFHA